MNNKIFSPKGDGNHRIIIKDILKHGSFDENPRARYKNGESANSRFITQKVIQYDITNNQSPMITLRPIAWKSAIKEILWIYQDQSNSLDILRNKYNIYWWDEWNVGDNTIGKRYGATVKRYDLINKLIKDLKENPFGRRHILSLWQEQDFSEDTKGLNPCAFMNMYSVRKQFLNNNKLLLDATLIQRSSDYPTSCAINEIQYLALQLMLAKVCGYIPGKFIHFIQNAHIYTRHIDAARELIARKSVECNPVLSLNTDKTDFYDFTIDDFVMKDYPLDKIKEVNPQINVFRDDIAI